MHVQITIKPQVNSIYYTQYTVTSNEREASGENTRNDSTTKTIEMRIVPNQNFEGNTA